MPGTAFEVIQWAERQLGYSEDGHSNRQKYAAIAHHTNGLAWCSTFVSAALIENGVNVPRPVLSPSSRTMYREAYARGWSHPVAEARPGDVIHMKRGQARLFLGHVGIVVARPANGKVATIEGNTNAKGSATGGSVVRHNRPLEDWTLGCWRPPYLGVVPPKPKELLLLPDGRICAWDGDVQGGYRLVTHVLSIPTVEMLKARGYKQSRYNGSVIVTSARP